MSPDDVKALVEKIDALTEAFHASAEQRAALSTEMKLMCASLHELNIAVMGDNGIRARLTKAEGKINVVQWLVMTIGGAFLVLRVAGFWQIATRVEGGSCRMGHWPTPEPTPSGRATA